MSSTYDRPEHSPGQAGEPQVLTAVADASFVRELSCAGSFPIDALNSPPGAERETGPEFDALREELRDSPAYDGVSYRLVRRDEGLALFVAGSESDWRCIAFRNEGGRWEWASSADGEELGVTLSGRDASRWVLDPAFPVPGPSTSALRILVFEQSCASGAFANGRIQPPLAEETDTDVTVTLTVWPLSGDQTCIDNPGTPAILNLPSSLRDRVLLDGSAYPPRNPTD